MAEQKKYNHAYIIGFSVESDDPEHCTFEEFLQGLLRRISDLEEIRYAYAEEGPYDTYEND